MPRAEEPAIDRDIPSRISPKALAVGKVLCGILITAAIGFAALVSADDQAALRIVLIGLIVAVGLLFFSAWRLVALGMFLGAAIYLLVTAAYMLACRCTF